MTTVPSGRSLEGCSSAPSDLAAMERALALAAEAGEHGDVPVGAVVTDAAGTIIGEGRNLREATRRSHRARRGRRAAGGRGIRRLLESRRLHARRDARAVPHVRGGDCCRRASRASCSARGTTRPERRDRCTTSCATGVCPTAPRSSAECSRPRHPRCCGRSSTRAGAERASRDPGGDRAGTRLRHTVHPGAATRADQSLPLSTIASVGGTGPSGAGCQARGR